jgi:hypothetical protein
VKRETLRKPATPHRVVVNRELIRESEFQPLSINQIVVDANYEPLEFYNKKIVQPQGKKMDKFRREKCSNTSGFSDQET